MRYFFSEQGRTRGCAETYTWYFAGGTPRRTPLRGKIAIYGWTLAKNATFPEGQQKKRCIKIETESRYLTIIKY